MKRIEREIGHTDSLAITRAIGRPASHMTRAYIFDDWYTKLSFTLTDIREPSRLFVRKSLTLK